jgi:hypothetical protein
MGRKKIEINPIAIYDLASQGMTQMDIPQART